MYQSERILVKVATKEGHAVFWLHEFSYTVDRDTGSIIWLTPWGAESRHISSSWSAERVQRAIEELTGPPNTIIKKVQQDGNGDWRDLNTGVKVHI